MTGPGDIRSALPDSGRLPRVGKLRLGIRKQSSKAGKMVEYPSAVDYFVVNEDAVTSRAAADSFHEVYGDEPREINVTLPAATLEDVLEGSWRAYGSGGLLKRKCSGPGGECVTRGPEGEWIDAPCQCAKENLDPSDKRNHCQERFTFTVMLMDVKGVGVWQIDTGSRWSASNLTEALKMIASFRGNLQGAQASLRVVPRQAAPGGVAKTIHVLELGSAELTPAQALELGGAPREPARVELPPSTLDEAPDDLIDAELAQLDAKVDELPDGPLSPPDAVGSPRTIGDQIKELSAMQRGELYRLAGIPQGSTMTVVRRAMNIAWQTNGLPALNGATPNLTVLLRELLDTERELRGPGDAEAFQHFVDTGQEVNPGDQMTTEGT